MIFCEFAWDDGWGNHTCHKEEGHPGDHLCQCDAFLSQWMAENGDEALEETAEEARLRLREELRELQAKDGLS